jgi:hypothetical protein
MPPHPAALLAALLLASASSAIPSPASAAKPESSCPVASSPAQPEKKRKGPGLGGLLGAVQRSGVGNLVGTGSLGDGRVAEAAGLAGALANGADPASAAAAAAGHGRTGALVGAAVGTAAELARSTSPECRGSAADTAEEAEEFTPTR